jgi:hypothetical protein
MPIKTVRANLSEREYMQFNILAAKRGLSRTLLALKVLQDWIAAQVRIDQTIEKDIISVLVETRTIHINTRQYAKLKRLQALVPECTVDNATDRNLTYPVSREAEVLEFLASCPKGSRNESVNPKEPKTYKAMDPTATPGLKAAKREREEKCISTPHSLIITEAMKVLVNGPLVFEELFSTLKERKRIPGGFNPRPILRRLLKESKLFDLNSSDIYSIRSQRQVDSSPELETVIEAPPISETGVEKVSSQPETSSPKVPTFFPRWAGS